MIRHHYTGTEYKPCVAQTPESCKYGSEAHYNFDSTQQAVEATAQLEVLKDLSTSTEVLDEIGTKYRNNLLVDKLLEKHPNWRGRFYYIHEDNIESLLRKLQRIRNKMGGVGFHYENLGAEFHSIKDENGNTTVRRFYKVRAVGTVKNEGWEFLAQLEHLEGGVVVRANQTVDYDFSPYYNAEAICEHCGANHNRKVTYLVRDINTGDVLQLGSTCLQEYTNGLSAETITQYMGSFDALIEGATPGDGGGMAYYDTEELLRQAVAVVAKNGYVPTSSPDSTADKAFEYCKYFNGHLRGEVAREIQQEVDSGAYDPHSEAVKTEAREILEWLRSGEAGEGDYIHNLALLSQQSHLNYKQHRLLASAPQAYRRYKREQGWAAEKKDRESARKAANALSQYQGSVGEKHTATVKEAMLLTSWDTQWGTTYLYEFRDEAGNIFTWKTAKVLDLASGDGKWSIAGTVKNHTEYNEAKQTELTRVKVSEVS